MRIDSPQASSKRGSIIVLVLVFVVLLTFIVVAFLEDATSKIKYYGLFHNRDDLRTDAYSALEITLATISQYREIEEALWGPAQGWNQPLEDFEFQPRHATRVTVSFEDESAKLPLRSLDYEMLTSLFEVMGFDLPEREALADGLLDWTDEDDLRRLNGFDSEDYEDLDPPYRAANAPIQTWDEFKLIRPFNTLFWDEEGRPTPQWNQFRNAVSLYHEGAVNINQAPPLVLALFTELGYLDMRALQYYKNGADGEPGTEDDRLLREPEGGIVLEAGNLISTTIELLRVKTVAERGDARFELETLLSWSGANPGAADFQSSENPSRARDVQISNPNSSRDQRRRATGSARTTPTAAAELGYPFRFLRIIENRKF